MKAPFGRIATVISDLDILRVGKDFADAAVGNPVCSGYIEIKGDKRYPWFSTLPIAETESQLRDLARREGKKVTFFQSQNL